MGGLGRSASRGCRWVERGGAERPEDVVGAAGGFPRDGQARAGVRRARGPSARDSRGSRDCPGATLADLRGFEERPAQGRGALAGELAELGVAVGAVHADVDGRFILRGCPACFWVRWWSRIRFIRCAGSGLRCCWSGGAARDRVFVCDAGGGRNCRTGRGRDRSRRRSRAMRRLSFEVLVGLAAVVAAIGRREGEMSLLANQLQADDCFGRSPLTRWTPRLGRCGVGRSSPRRPRSKSRRRRQAPLTPLAPPR